MGSRTISCFRGQKSSKVDMDGSSGVYHEKQVKELCAIHSINNLLQAKVFEKKDFDKLSDALSPNTFLNPHRSILGTGNYDINVIMAALQSQGLDLIWFDKRKDVKELRLENINGFILNIPSDYKLGGLIPFNFNRKHWISVREVGGVYYNLDSKLGSPERLDSLLNFLGNQVNEKDRELLLVVSKEVQESSSWKTTITS
ncbi:josephin-2-like [Watersipora subatra]|uniref:josephin-2-like n=1 Tax=Watersipora subatra TaxID=2589382 RepID=UPI00355BF6DD